jgi:hypothetical protein
MSLITWAPNECSIIRNDNNFPFRQNPCAPLSRRYYIFVSSVSYVSHHLVTTVVFWKRDMMPS